jgi:alpha-L-fucosidase 2
MEFKYTIDMNFAPNGMSVYTAGSWPYTIAEPFQIDANFGLVGAALAMLTKDLPQAYGDTSVHRVQLGVAIPAAWSPGSVQGMRLRGGGAVDFSWDATGLVTSATVSGHTAPINLVNANGDALA